MQMKFEKVFYNNNLFSKTLKDIHAPCVYNIDGESQVDNPDQIMESKSQWCIKFYYH